MYLAGLSLGPETLTIYNQLEESSAITLHIYPHDLPLRYALRSKADMSYLRFKDSLKKNKELSLYPTLITGSTAIVRMLEDGQTHKQMGKYSSSNLSLCLQI